MAPARLDFRSKLRQRHANLFKKSVVSCGYKPSDPKIAKDDSKHQRSVQTEPPNTLAPSREEEYVPSMISIPSPERGESITYTELPKTCKSLPPLPRNHQNLRSTPAIATKGSEETDSLSRMLGPSGRRRRNERLRQWPGLFAPPQRGGSSQDTDTHPDDEETLQNKRSDSSSTPNSLLASERSTPSSNNSSIPSPVLKEDRTCATSDTTPSHNPDPPMFPAYLVHHHHHQQQQQHDQPEPTGTAPRRGDPVGASPMRHLVPPPRFLVSPPTLSHHGVDPEQCFSPKSESTLNVSSLADWTGSAFTQVQPKNIPISCKLPDESLELSAIQSDIVLGPDPPTVATPEEENRQDEVSPFTSCEEPLGKKRSFESNRTDTTTEENSIDAPEQRTPPVVVSPNTNDGDRSLLSHNLWNDLRESARHDLPELVDQIKTEVREFKADITSLGDEISITVNDLEEQGPFVFFDCCKGSEVKQ